MKSCTKSQIHADSDETIMLRASRGSATIQHSIDMSFAVCFNIAHICGSKKDSVFGAHEH